MTILPMTVVAAVGGGLWLGAPFAMRWLVAALLMIGVSQAVCRWIETRPAAGRGHEAALAAFTFVYCVAYCVLPVALLLHGEQSAAVAGAAMMGAIAISSTSEFVISRPIG